MRAILQSRVGYLWLGKEEGLVRFDGLRFEAFSSLSEEGLPSDEVRALTETPSGDLWIGTYVGGLTRMRGGRLERVGRTEGRAWTA